MLAREAVVLPAMLGGVGVPKHGEDSERHVPGLWVVDVALPLRLLLPGLRVLALLPMR